MNRRGFLGSLAALPAVVVAFVAAKPTAARRWIETNMRPPGHVQSITRVNFDGATFEVDDAALHRLLDEALAQARVEMARCPSLNVWRIGELQIRWRAGELKADAEGRSFLERQKIWGPDAEA